MSAARTPCWTAVWVPLVLFVVLLLALNVTMLVSRPYPFTYDDAGSLMALLPMFALAGAVTIAATSRYRTRWWLAPTLAAVVSVFGLFGVWQNMARVWDYLAHPVYDSEQPERIFLVAAGESLSSAALGAVLGALLLTTAAFALTYHARHRADLKRRAPRRRWAAVLGFLSFVGLWFARSGLELQRWEGVFPTLFAGLAMLALVLGARALGDDKLGERRDDLLDVSLSGAAAIMLATLGSVVRGIGWVWQNVEAESVAPQQRLRIIAEAVPLTSAELTLSLLCLGALGLVAVVLLLPHRAPVRAPIGARAAFLLAAVALPSAATGGQIASFDSERVDTRPGKPGEFVADRHLPSGSLVVDLDPIQQAMLAQPEASVRLSDGTTKPWTVDEPAVFEGLELGSEVSFWVQGGYRARSAGSVRIPPGKGVRVRVPVLRILPIASDTSDRSEPERVLHIDTADPTRFRLLWASASVVHASSDIPRDVRRLAEAVERGWKEHGSHRNEADRRFDTAVIRHLDGAPFDELVQVANAIGETTRTFRYQQFPAFRVFTATAFPFRPSIDAEVDPARWAAAASDSERTTRARNALTRCEGEPCASAFGDPFGAELGRWCDRPVCSPRTVAALWMELGESLSQQGDAAGSLRAFRKAVLIVPQSRLPASTSEPARAAFAVAARKPMPRVRPGATTLNGRLAPKVVQAALAAREGLFRACYDEGLDRSPQLQGRIAMRFVIDREGTATHFANAGSDLPDSSVVTCVLRAARGLTFPPPEGGIVTVVQPHMFTP